ncbi:NADPH HC-toxin reductase 1-like [Primulina tabacum]|uniref:NADPH HC-toxin reductase 1-like n=1 Tax=Primulina tabacum TaxID=48773 RepID=UPI003F5A2991
MSVDALAAYWWQLLVFHMDAISLYKQRMRTLSFANVMIQYKNRVDVRVDSAKRIASLCIGWGTVKRLIYTASVMAASPLKDGRSTYKENMDETSWTPANFSIPYTNDYHVEEYANRELLSFGNGEMEVVTLACGLVG